MIGLVVERVVDDVVVSGIDCALSGRLRDQVEVEPLGSRHDAVDDRAVGRVGETLAGLGEEARIASLLDHNECDCWPGNDIENKTILTFRVHKEAVTNKCAYL